MLIDVQANFPAVRALEAHFDEIRREASQLSPDDYFEYLDPMSVAGSWRLFVLHAQVPDWTYARDVERNRARCPRTWELVKDVPGSVLVSFSYLAPQTHVYPHVDNDRPYMLGAHSTARCHMGIDVPSDCPIRIGEVLSEYEEGRFVAFDAARHRHEVGNRSNRGRVTFCVEVEYDVETLVE